MDRVDHKKSGSFLITTKTLQQVHTIMKAKTLTEDNIPIKTTIAYTNQLSYGRIYAPEFLECSLQDWLEMLKPCNVVGVRNLYQDSNRASSSLYVLTFLPKKCPERIQAGYSSCRVHLYYQSPSLCLKCCRWNHTSTVCSSIQVCNKCGKKGHKQAECSSETTRCVNCSGQHPETSKS